MGPGQYGTNEAVIIAPYKNPRRNVNWCGLLLSLLMPWVMFVAINATMTFSIRFSYPDLAYFIDALGLIVIIGLFIFTYLTVRKYLKGNVRMNPNWLIFLFASTLLAWIFAIVVGNQAYNMYTRPVLEMSSLSSYPEVDPSTANGQQYMDAGRVYFQQGSYVDMVRSMGFKSDHMYCVAPIAIGSAELSKYSFWAVGTDCCSGGTSNFHCGEYDIPHALGGYRLLNDDQRPYYRLAVQQAEAAYHLKAPHPLFFKLVQDPLLEMHNVQGEGTTFFLLAILTALVVQCFFVASAMLVFSKFGFQEPSGIDN